MLWFSSLRAEGEAILLLIHQQITSVCYRKPRNDACFLTFNITCYALFLEVGK